MVVVIFCLPTDSAKVVPQCEKIIPTASTLI